MNFISKKCKTLIILGNAMMSGICSRIKRWVWRYKKKKQKKKQTFGLQRGWGVGNGSRRTVGSHCGNPGEKGGWGVGWRRSLELKALTPICR